MGTPARHALAGATLVLCAYVAGDALTEHVLSQRPKPVPRAFASTPAVVASAAGPAPASTMSTMSSASAGSAAPVIAKEEPRAKPVEAKPAAKPEPVPEPEPPVAEPGPCGPELRVSGALFVPEGQGESTVMLSGPAVRDDRPRRVGMRVADKTIAAIYPYAVVLRDDSGAECFLRMWSAQAHAAAKQERLVRAASARQERIEAARKKREARKAAVRARVEAKLKAKAKAKELAKRGKR